MDCKNRIILFLLATYILIEAQGISFALKGKNVVPKSIEISKYFNLYASSKHGIDLKELYRGDNNPILNACLTGATLDKLKKLGIEDLQERLEKLQTGKIVRKINTHYYLAFPAIVGEKRAEFQKLVTQTGLKLLPTTQKMIQEIMPHIENDREMLYHVLWSIVMDGPIAWDTTLAELQARIKEGDTKIENTAWIIYPNHSFRCGTNGYGGSDSQVLYVSITWNQDPGLPNRIHSKISKYKSELIQSKATAQPVKATEAKKALAEYGLVDDKGMCRAHIIDINSPAAKTYYKLGYEFGHGFMAHFDAEKVADILGVSPGQALVIAYHEVCYEILKQLATKDALKIPQKIEANQMYRLISFVTVSEPNKPISFGSKGEKEF